MREKERHEGKKKKSQLLSLFKSHWLFLRKGKRFFFLFIKIPLNKIPHVIFVKSLIIGIFYMLIYFYFIKIFTLLKYGDFSLNLLFFN